MNEKGLTKNDSQCLKGVGILLMLFYHLFRTQSVFKGHDISFYPFDEHTVVAASYMCKICVCVFAFVTGYGLLKSIKNTQIDRNSVARWNVKRLLKTMSGFYFIYVIAFVVTFAIDGLPKSTYFTGSVLKGILYVILDFLGLSNLFSTPMLIGTWWYMSAAVIYILLVPLIYEISKKMGGYLPVVITVAMIPTVLKIGFTGGRNPYTFLLVMIFGMIFADYNLFEKINGRLPGNKMMSYISSFFIFGGVSAFFCFLSERKDSEAGWQLIYSVFPVFVICFLRYCVIRIPVVRQILSFLGKYSMTIFLTHTFIRYNYLNGFVYSFGNFIKIYAVLLVLSLALAVVLDTVKKLIRYNRLVNRVTSLSLVMVDKIVK